MVLLGGVETVSGAIVGAIVYKALNIWLVSQTDLSKLVLGGFIVLIVVVFSQRHRRDAGDDQKSPAVLIVEISAFHLPHRTAE